jgi:hypothetical protein
LLARTGTRQAPASMTDNPPPFLGRGVGQDPTVAEQVDLGRSIDPSR